MRSSKFPYLILCVLAFLLLITEAVCKEPAKEAELLVRHRVNTPSPSTTKIQIKEVSPGVFECWTKSIPKHRLQAEGFTQLKAPFASDKNTATCDDVVWWLEPGKKDPSGSACYKQKRFPVLDEILTSCLNV